MSDTVFDGEEFGQGIVDLVRGYVDKRCPALEERVRHLEAREQNLKYLGTFEQGTEYFKGNFVTRNGSLWCCLAERTSARPVFGAAQWQLAVKAGRDAPRDAR